MTDYISDADAYLQDVEHIAAHLTGGVDTETQWCDLDTGGLCEVAGAVDDGTAFLSVETRGETAENAHVRVAVALGGPNVWLTRDWHGDALLYRWGSFSATRRSDAVTAVLNYYADLAEGSDHATAGE